MMHRLPRRSGLVDVRRSSPGQTSFVTPCSSDMDSVPLAVGVGTQLLLRRQRHLGGAVSLTHLENLLLCGARFRYPVAAVDSVAFPRVQTVSDAVHGIQVLL